MGVAILIVLVASPAVSRAGEGSWDDLMRGGTVVVDHPPHNTGGLASDTDFLDNFGDPLWQRVADQVTVAQSATIGRIKWWGFYHLDNPPVDETFRIRLYGARPTDGLPDECNLLFEHTTSTQNRTGTGRRIASGVAPHEYLFDTALPSPFTLPAGVTRWLEIVQVGDPSTRFRWEFSLADDNGQAFNNPIVGDWQATSSTSSNSAFQLIAVPETSTLLAVLPALVLIVRTRRSHRA